MSEADDLFGEEHIRRYRETDGEVGYLWRGGPKTSCSRPRAGTVASPAPPP